MIPLLAPWHCRDGGAGLSLCSPPAAAGAEFSSAGAGGCSGAAGAAGPGPSLWAMMEKRGPALPEPCHAQAQPCPGSAPALPSRAQAVPCPLPALPSPGAALPAGTAQLPSVLPSPWQGLMLGARGLFSLPSSTRPHRLPGFSSQDSGISEQISGVLSCRTLSCPSSTQNVPGPCLEAKSDLENP